MKNLWMIAAVLLVHPEALCLGAGRQATELEAAEGSRLIGQPVFLRNGEQLGWVEQILVDAEMTAVTSLAISIAAEAEVRVVPREAFALEEDGRVVLLLEDALAEAPRIISTPLEVPPEDEELETEPPPDYADLSMAAISFAPFDPVITIEGAPAGVVRGVVIDVEPVPVEGAGTHLLLLVDMGRVNVFVDVGSEARLEALGVELVPGDPIRVMGTKTIRDGEVVIDASQIMVGSRVIRLNR